VAAAPARPALPRAGVLEGTVDITAMPLWPQPSATLFSGKRYRGRSQTFSVGQVPHLRGTRIRDNAVSSLRLAGGAQLTLYLKPQFVGRSETFVKDHPNLARSRIRNNRASSLRVEPPDTGPFLWLADPIRTLGRDVSIERHRNGVIVRTDRGTAWVASELVPHAGPGLEQLIRTRPGLAKALGSPRNAGVRVARGRLAVQLFRRGVVVCAPDLHRGWYHLDRP